MNSSCGCCCCCSCPCCGCGGGNNNGVGGVTTPSLTQFPVYVAYPAFFAGDSAIEGANFALFTRR